MLIVDYFWEIQKLITACEIVHSSSITYDERTAYIGFIRGDVHFLDGSVLHFREFVNVESGTDRYIYAYQYMRGSQMVFRYDNTGHHRKLSLPTFPHHRHDGFTGRITASPAPNLAAVLDEIRRLLPPELPGQQQIMPSYPRVSSSFHKNFPSESLLYHIPPYPAKAGTDRSGLCQSPRL
ncbi:MAG: toxin-antitoxin system TumE family protein [Anaerolineae bacterium]